MNSTLGYAVRDFFTNGGSQAIIVRLYHKKTGTLSNAKVDCNGLKLEAASEGEWGNQLRARVDHDVLKDVADSMGINKSDLFNLTVHDRKTGVTETFRNVSVKTSPRQIDNVLKQESYLVRADGSLPSSRPSKHDNPASGKDIWDDNNPATNSKVVSSGEASDGDNLQLSDFTGTGKEDAKQGLYALKKADLFNILCIPPYLANENVNKTLITSAATLCENQRAMLLVDPKKSWTDKDKAKSGISTGVGTTSKNSAIFFPRLKQANPLKDNQLEEFVPCGAVAGLFARTDSQRGVWKAPAGIEATLRGVPELSVNLNDAENGELNGLGVNCLRTLPPAGRVIWGARTMQGDDRFASEWKYIPVRRTALFLEESLFRGLKWVVFEPNDEPLWSQIRLNVGAFMHNLFRQGAFQGQTPRDAYLVKCDSETTTQNDINLGIVNILVGFAPLKPAEFVIIKIQQLAGQIQA